MKTMLSKGVACVDARSRTRLREQFSNGNKPASPLKVEKIQMSKEHTPTPWMWQDFGRGLILVSSASGRPIVMDFIRQGMNGAEPRFGRRTDAMGGIMVPLSKWETLPPDLEFMTRAANEYDADKEALRGVAIMLNTELTKYENEPWAQRVRAALADKDF